REPHLVIRDFRRHAAAMGEWKSEEWARWHGLFSEQQASGQSIAGFCRERALPVWQFYEWRKRLRVKTEPFVAVEVVASAPAPLPTLPPPVLSAPIEIRLRSGRSLLVGPDFEASHLCRLLRVLEQEP
ncbi:MAG: hypothetical protein JOY85_03985, partial [Acidobacteriaceae bacterium]|nr:hypothetical protein [Acidobacteriaceae bacterium]